MSLLNDALRNAEQRQKGSGSAAPGVYTGAGVQSRERSRWPLMLVVLLMIASLGAAGAWYGLNRGNQQSVAAQAGERQAEATGQVQRVPVQPKVMPEVIKESPPASESVTAGPEPATEPGPHAGAEKTGAKKEVVPLP